MASTAAARNERYINARNAMQANLRTREIGRAREVGRAQIGGQKQANAHTRTAPAIRTRERPHAIPRVKVREAGYVSAFAVLGFLAAGVLAVLLLLSYIQLMTTADATVSMRQELHVLEEENIKLRTQYELAYDLKSIEQAVLSTGMMVKPQSGQIIVLDLSEPDNVVVFAEPAGPSILDRALVWAKSLIFGRME